MLDSIGRRWPLRCFPSMLALLAPSVSLRSRVVRVLVRHLTADGSACAINTCGTKRLRKWSDVAWKAQQEGNEVNLGYLFALCVEKNSELPA
eukprot:11653265-Heterocapsa_arctica.AAC.1